MQHFFSLKIPLNDSLSSRHLWGCSRYRPTMLPPLLKKKSLSWGGMVLRGAHLSGRGSLSHGGRERARQRPGFSPAPFSVTAAAWPTPRSSRRHVSLQKPQVALRSLVLPLRGKKTLVQPRALFRSTLHCPCCPPASRASFPARRPRAQVFPRL